MNSIKKLLILLLLPLTLFAIDYQKEWSDVNKFDKQHLPKSSLKMVETIFEQAKVEKNENQYIRALIYKTKYLQKLKENGLIKAIRSMENAVENAPTQNSQFIISSLLAQMYQQYLAQNQYKIKNRSSLSQQESKSIETWNIKQLVDKISALYLRSLDSSTQEVSIKNYAYILTKGENIEGLRPTLYDFLAYRALQYFQNKLYFLTEPSNAFNIKEKEAFSSIDTFIHHPFKSDDTASFQYQSLKIYQELLSFHQQKKQLKALQHSNLARLQYVYKNAHIKDKDTIYVDRLRKISIENSEAYVYLAQYFMQQNNLVKAIFYAQKGLNTQDTYIIYQSQNIKNHIEVKTLQLQIETVNLPEENILAKIEYKNINKIFVKVFKLTEKQIDKLKQTKYRARINYINSLNAFKKFNFKTIENQDYQPHSIEVSLGHYDLGQYLFLLSTDETFSKKNIYQFSTVSNIAYLQQNKKLLIVHRKTGQPMENVEVLLTQKRQQNPLIITKISDKDGFIDVSDLQGSYTLHLKQGKDILNPQNHNQIYLDNDGYHSYGTYKQTYFFMDRSIYRPNQSIYFKGLSIQTFQNKAPKILPNQKITVTFFDANHQKIESKQFISDEFGTFNGTFTAPKNGLLGTMYLNSSLSGEKSFKVEEYKRPKFEVSFKPLEKSYHLGETIQLIGEAKAYAGNPIDGAKVKYRVERSSYFPWRCYWEPTPYSGNKLLTSGESRSDEKGEFKITFEALDEPNIRKKHPNYRYTIYVDVTDSTGETHSNSKSIQLGDIDLKVAMILPPELNLDENASIHITSTNLNNEFKAIQGVIVVEKLEEEKKIYKRRYWQKPDNNFYTKEKFEKLFKYYRFDTKEQVRKKKILSTFPFNTKQSKTVSLNKLEQGEYILTLKTIDEKGEELTLSSRVILYHPKAQHPPFYTYLWQKQNQKSYKVGEKAIINFQTSIQTLPLLFTLEQNGKILREKWLNITGLTQEIINIKNESQGNLNYQINFIKENRPYHEEGRIHVPWNNKLKIEYISFRDKLKPNEEEIWKIKISGENKESVMAQMVATMYDASLDNFVPHNFSLKSIFPQYYNAYLVQWRSQVFNNSSTYQSWREENPKQLQRIFSNLKWINKKNNIYQRHTYADPYGSVMENSFSPVMPITSEAKRVMKDSAMTLSQDVNSASKKIKNIQKQAPISIRKNLNETMFFKPNLQTDEDGNIIINFKTNGALTRWNFLAFAHTKALQTAITKKTITTQKELMVVTNLPRFFREKDKILLSAKVINMSDKNLTGEYELQLINPSTGKAIYEKKFKRPFTLTQGQSTIVNFAIQIPNIENVSAIQHTLIARTSTHTDAEQVIKPILSNRIFITESKVLSLKAHESKSFTLESLKNNHSNTLKKHKLSLEFTSNPAWYAIQSLPYLMEYEHECSEQLFSRYYANALSANLLNGSPKIKQVFDSWHNKNQLKSKLTLNKELKGILLEESPWILEGKSQEEEQKNIALLFDLNRLAKEQKNALNKLKERQLPNGGFTWFGGNHANWYITQYIVEGLGHLNALGVDTKEAKTLFTSAISYIDQQIVREYNELSKHVKDGKTTFEADNLRNLHIHYLYTRSFFKPTTDIKIVTAQNYYLDQAQKYWTNKNLYEEGMIALALHRAKKDAKYIVASLKERAIINDKMGMYFKQENGYYWYQLPIETHTLMIEVFEEIAKDQTSVEQLKVWLLKQRQTTHWKTTKATSSAIYVLLSKNKWLENSSLVDVSFNTTLPYQKKLEKAKTNAIKGLGYFKVSYQNFDNSMATVQVKNPNDNIAWGAMYWQYFEEMDKIKTFKETPLTIDKKLYKVHIGNKGEELIALEKNTMLTVGDKIKVRIEIRVDRMMEYVMLKDSRASTFEPLNVLSTYKYQDGLGYYENTKDNATYFFFDQLPKGTYVFEYPLIVTHKGSFSNGITTMESMYAPEFKSHSEGVQIKVK